MTVMMFKSSDDTNGYNDFNEDYMVLMKKMGPMTIMTTTSTYDVLQACWLATTTACPAWGSRRTGWPCAPGPGTPSSRYGTKGQGWRPPRTEQTFSYKIFNPTRDQISPLILERTLL